MSYWRPNNRYNDDGSGTRNYETPYPYARDSHVDGARLTYFLREIQRKLGWQPHPGDFRDEVEYYHHVSKLYHRCYEESMRHDSRPAITNTANMPQSEYDMIAFSKQLPRDVAPYNP